MSNDDKKITSANDERNEREGDRDPNPNRPNTEGTTADTERPESVVDEGDVTGTDEIVPERDERAEPFTSEVEVTRLEVDPSAPGTADDAIAESEIDVGETVPAVLEPTIEPAHVDAAEADDVPPGERRFRQMGDRRNRAVVDPVKARQNFEQTREAARIRNERRVLRESAARLRGKEPGPGPESREAAGRTSLGRRFGK